MMHLESRCFEALYLFILMQFRDNAPPPVFHPEFGRFMIETTPGKPRGIDLKELLDVERDMRLRYVYLIILAR